MELNADFSRPALVRADETHWTASPMPGVERLMLDRIGGEVARATSLVRYAPHSRFKAHTHERGEEFLVLEGTFSDAEGNYGPGTYVRNPPGSSHAPWSEAGCTLFVKLRQFNGRDRAHKVVDTTAGAAWTPAGDRANRLPLHSFGQERVELLRLGKGCRIRVSGAGGLELLVIEGSIQVAELMLGRHDWLRLPPESGAPLLVAGSDACLFVRSGHLNDVESAAVPRG